MRRRASVNTTDYNKTNFTASDNTAADSKKNNSVASADMVAYDKK